MSFFDRKTTFDTVRLGIFVVVTTVATALLAVTIGNISFNPTTKYRAVFTDAVGLNQGDDVRIAGVKVGQVDKIALYQNTLAMVTFSVDSDQVIDTSTHATLRYRNLVGNRYVALTDGIGGGDRLKKNGVIPKERTTPALDLSVLFNGFKPLFTALTPADVNQFAFEVIKVLQGEGGTIESLLAKTASLTTTLADADQVIGDLITNLTSTLQIVSQRQANFSQLLVNLQQFITGLSQDINPILSSLTSINSLNTKTAGLLQQTRVPIKADLDKLRAVATTLDDTQSIWVKTLQFMPEKLNTMTRTASYGSWFNFYLCNFDGNVTLPTGTRIPVAYDLNSARCKK
ncbi:phospholipid/cholesterol/gamma-HCH transport system substrate-binding protein [Kribbella pratensis]|jgi:phospholipid/cholesterol/gamma-HCH transport system substrate-binding protein|uniref:Phospholipid/cholesterol/gamma-HCH transport system substrate-binding protein n=1 Tax=Kribbella pratensis TaxID=2512112 RepID=A0ABY2FCF2_9ACTN|nr:MlaD family protein [Kribbella pratensis]TDW87911.1 phospholipid/cholesterol/gamma-HCH transport system substrate-binding protein [Kribbella pratensis]